MACAALACAVIGLKSAFTPSLPSSMATAGRGMAERQRTLTQRYADGSGLTPFGPVVQYAKALTDAAREKGEDVAVTEDVLMIKENYNTAEFLDKLPPIMNDPALTEVEKAAELIKLLPKLKSTIMPKFITFLAKKKRLNGIKVICFEYVQSLYWNQGITPVRVTSAQRLTEDQISKIKEKMKGKVDTTDVKIITEIDPSLLGGFTLEWGYTDPILLTAPTYGLDFSLKEILSKRALQRGVVDAL